MPFIKINGQHLDVDIRGELEQFEWIKPRWTSDKLIAASPFRYDSTPSFFVNLDGEYAGTWADSGAYDADYESGNFAKLLAFLRDETYEETVEYLFEMYGGPKLDESGKVSIPPVKLEESRRRIALSEEYLDPYRFRHPYLGKRGISEKVQRFMGVGYSKKDKAVTMPWRHPDGSLANVKFRKVYGKAFWYSKDAAPIRTLVYGIDKVYRHNLTEVVVCEAEIDAMSWMTDGKAAIAVGGTTVTKKQLDLIRKSPIERLIIARDNDKAGGKLGRKLFEGLNGYVELAEITIPSEFKDANDALVAGVKLDELPVKGIEGNKVDKYSPIVL